MRWYRKSQVDIPKDPLSEWFGGSKVVDEKGQPLVVYHGTIKEFTDFRPGTQAVGGAIYFGDLEEAKAQAGKTRDSRVIPAYLKIDRLWDYEDPESLRTLAEHLNLTAEEIQDLEAGTDAYTNEQGLYKGAMHGNYDTIESEEFQGFLHGKGYDGFTLNQYGGTKNYAVYDPSQIKTL
jgi:hypothetical protein